MTAPPRVRRDPHERAVRSRRDSARPEAQEIRTVPASAPLVLVAPELARGRLTKHDREVLGAGRGLADEIGGALGVLVHNLPSEDLQSEFQKLGIDRLVRCAVPEDLELDAGARAACLDTAIRSLDPRYVLIPDSGASSDIGRRAAARLTERPAAGVVRLSAPSVDCRIDAGSSEITRPTPRILLLAPNTFSEISAAERREVKLIEVAYAGAPAPQMHVVETIAADPRTLPLMEADLVLSAGNGVTDWSSFHRLASLLGAAEAGSRVACDLGHLPRDRQVGVSGVLVAPRCYLALGIAGASQHLEGIASCERVVAVNTDPHAEILKRANLAIVADAQQVMPALIGLLESRNGS